MTQRAELIFVILLIPFSGGILISRSLVFTELNSVLLFSLILVFLLLLTSNILYKPLKVYHHTYPIGFFINVLFFLFGLYHSTHHQLNRDPRYFTGRPATFMKIKIADEPQLRQHILRFNATVLAAYDSHQKHEVTGNLLVALSTDSLKKPELNYGDILIIPTRYSPVPPPANPAEFDFRFWLSNKNIYQQTFLRADQFFATGRNDGNPVIRFSLALRQQQIAFYRSIIKDDEAYAVASTLILGYRADLSAETLSAYSRTGTIHALSVSGMHVGIIYLVLDRALQFMNRKKLLKMGKAVLVLLLIWGYTLLSGCSASVLRSAIMLTVFVIAKAAGRQSNSYNILAFSAFCLLVYDPFLLWDTGFQLSYLSVFGLICLQTPIHSLLQFKSTWLSKLWSMVSLSLAAQITTFPFSIYYFHQFPLYFIFSNLFITLPMAILMYLGIGILLLRATWLAPLFEYLILFTNRGLSFIAALPYSSLGGIWISRPQLLLLCLGMITLVAAIMHRKKKLFFCAIALLTCLQGSVGYDKIRCTQQQQIIPFVLNRNYAVAFISADTAIIVTDLQPGDKTFIFSVQPALEQLRVNQISCTPLEKDTLLGGLTIRHHQLIWKNHNILVVDSTLRHQRMLHRPVFDIVWLHGPLQIKLEKIWRQTKFTALWIDGKNSTYMAAKYNREAANLRLRSLLLKKMKHL